MKVKEVAITASIAWSPATLQSPRLVCATAAKHADPTSKNALVQVYSLNLGEENLSMKLDGSISAVTKFNDVVWGVGGQQVSGGAGVVACAGDNGGIYLYNGKQLMSGSSGSLIKVMEGKHSGPVYALDFNVHQLNLLASGSQDCEVFIWDINDPAVPMSPGTKATLASDVSSVAWNRQVEHILACAYAGRCVVFDLRKSTSIVQISDAVSRMKASTVCWHPSVATQMVIASEDDLTPVCQVWDLRFASAPLKQFDGHQRGVQKLDWCMQDHDIICSAAKDNRMLCWSASTAEQLCEVPSYNQWSFDVAWCRRDPALVASATVDGTVSVFSLLGGGYPPARDVKFSAIADSFPGMEMPSETPVSVQPQTVYLARPPAFFPSKSGCSFGFGGQLLSWNAGSGVVTISQVVTEPDLVQRGNDLLAALGGAGVHQFCADKLADLADDHERELWEFISAGLAGEAAAVQYLSLLGYPAPPALNEDPSSALSAQMGALNTAEGSTGSLDPSEQFEMIASAQSSDKTPEPELLDPDSPGPEGRHVVVSPDGAGGAIRRAIITGQLDEAVDLCLQDSKYTLALILSQHASPELYQKTRDRVLSLESDSDALCGVTAAVVKTDLEAVVAQCSLDNWKEVVVTVINHAPAELRPQLLQRLGSRLEFSNELQNALLCYLVAGALDNFVQCWVKTKPVGSALSTQHLQDLVEVVLVVQQSGAALSTDGDAGAAVGQFLAQYASLLATQGALQTALYYLASSASLDSQAELVALRTRLERALGYSDAGNSHSSASRTRTTSTSSLQPTYRRASAPSAAFQPPQFTPSVQARQAAAFNAPPPAAAPAAPPAISSGQPSAFYQPAQQPQTFAPPPPATGGHQYGGYQAHPPPPAAAALPPPAPPAASVTAPGGLRRPGAGARYVSTAVNSTPAYQNNPAAFQPTPAFQPPSAAAPFQPVPSQPFQPVTSQPFQSIPTSSSFLDPNPSYPSSLVPPPPPHAAGDPIPYGVDAAAQPTEPPKPPAAYNPTVPRGWNDPPPMSASRRAKQQQQPPPQQSSPAPSMMVPAQATPPPPATGFQGFQGFAPQSPPSGFGAPPPSSSQGMNAQQSTSPLLPPVAPLPLPAEAQGIYNVLNGLYTRGLAAAPNMMIRQTYDSVGPKLEILYEKLRSRQVGATTMQGLHSLCSCVEAGDYHQALQAHSQTVSAGNFAEMSPFMPAVKKLLTTSMQCQIFLN